MSTTTTKPAPKATAGITSADCIANLHKLAKEGRLETDRGYLAWTACFRMCEQLKKEQEEELSQNGHSTVAS